MMKQPSVQQSCESDTAPPASPQVYSILPVIGLEFLAIAITKAVLPKMLLQHYPNQVYLVMGCAECSKGLLAFVCCPWFGKLSDRIGRKPCLFWTVVGTCLPVAALAVLPWENVDSSTDEMMTNDSTEIITNIINDGEQEEEGSAMYSFWTTFTDYHPHQEQLTSGSMTIFIILLSLSGIFSGTFTLVFSYISDCSGPSRNRVTAYGMAMATLGLSFTMGPMGGGYLAQQYGMRSVFWLSLIFTIIDLCYIYWYLPESNTNAIMLLNSNDGENDRGSPTRENEEDEEGDDNASMVTTNTSSTIKLLPPIISNIWTKLYYISSSRHRATKKKIWTKFYSPLENTFSILTQDPILQRVGTVALWYYTALWAVVSTLIFYAAQRFQMTPSELGELMSLLGFCTMVSEAVLVRYMVPWLGEAKCVTLGLRAFLLQCLILGVATQSWHLYVSCILSLLGNLVYPSLSSLVSDYVPSNKVGEALGALNGIKALTEGIGPLVFGSFMTISTSRKGGWMGWPYWIAAYFVYMSLHYAQKLPSSEYSNGVDDEVYELKFRPRPDDEDDYQYGLDGDEAEEYQNLLVNTNDDDDDNIQLNEIDSSEEHHHFTEGYERSKQHHHNLRCSI